VSLSGLAPVSYFGLKWRTNRVLTPGAPGCSLLESHAGQLMGNKAAPCISPVGSGSIVSSARNSSRQSGLPQVSVLNAFLGAFVIIVKTPVSDSRIKGLL